MKLTRSELQRQLKRSLTGNILMLIATLAILAATVGETVVFKGWLRNSVVYTSPPYSSHAWVLALIATAMVVSFFSLVWEHRFAPADCVDFVQRFYDASQYQKYPVREWNYFMTEAGFFWRTYLRLNVHRARRVWRTAHLAARPPAAPVEVRRQGITPLAS